MIALFPRFFSAAGVTDCTGAWLNAPGALKSIKAKKQLAAQAPGIVIEVM
jgi:hypothetical protein